MKKIAGLVIILAVLILGGYYGMGFLTEKTIRKNVAVIDQSNGLHAEIEQYHRGWFRSHAHIKWHLHIPEHVAKNDKGESQVVLAQDYDIEMPLTVYHGPIIFTGKKIRFGFGYAETAFPFPKRYYDQFDAQFTKESIKPHLDLSIFVNYLNESTVDFKIPSFNLISKGDNSRFEWLGMDSSTTMSSGLRKIQGKVVLEGLNATKEDTKISLSQATSDYDLHETSSGLYLGDANFSLPSFEVYIKAQKLFEINKLVVTSASDIEQHLFSTHFNVTIKSVLANGQTYGPGNLEVALRNLDADVLGKINEQTAAMQNGTDAQRQQAMLAILPELPQLFSKGSEFEISKMSLKIPQGQIEGNFYITLPKAENMNSFELIQKIQGKAKLQVPIAAVKEIMNQSVIQQMSQRPDLQHSLMLQFQGAAPQGTQTSVPTAEQLAVMQTNKQLESLEKAGLIKIQGDNYVVEASLDQGKVMVNGKPYDSSMMKVQ